METTMSVGTPDVISKNTTTDYVFWGLTFQAKTRMAENVKLKEAPFEKHESVVNVKFADSTTRTDTPSATILVKFFPKSKSITENTNS
jgi:hypothetical protein